MSERYVVVVDAGSTRIRCYVFGSDGGVVAERSAAWSYVEPEVPSPYVWELDAERVWHSMAGLILNCIGDSKIEARRIAAMAATSQRQGVVFLDREDDVLYAGPNTDIRAIFEGGVIDDSNGEQVFQVTGRQPSLLFTAAKLRWFSQHKPEVYERIDRVVTLADWLRWRLSGELVSEATLAAEAGLLDVRKREWCSGLFDELGIKDIFGVPMKKAGTMAGSVRREVADDIGVPAGIPVVVCPADTQCGLLGLGTGRVGQVGIVAGWSIPLLTVTEEPIFDTERRIWTGCHAVQGFWSLESTCGDAGNSYRWLADTVWEGSADPFGRMDEAAGDMSAGSDGVLAYLGASRMDMGRIGMRTGGFSFPTPLTYSGIGRGHLTRAALESIAYAARANLEQLECVGGFKASKVAVGGGMIGTSTWVEMLPNVLGRPVEVATTENVTAAGAYVSAIAALDGCDSLVELAEASAETKTITPSAVGAAEYDDHYRMWNEMGKHMRSAGM